jgi:phenylpyruvate tautomerase PptA (4-oxalocrotonate tautomerase family)
MVLPSRPDRAIGKLPVINYARAGKGKTNMASRYVSITYADLNDETKEELVKTIVESLMELYKQDGEAAMLRKWHVQPKTWQEAICRENCIDSNMWDDLEETSEEFQKYDWNYALQEHLEEEAEQKLWRAFKYTELEVEL